MAGELTFHYDGAAVEHLRTLIVCPILTRRTQQAEEVRSIEATVEEAISLTEAIELVVADVMVVKLATPNPATLIGKGKLEEIKQRIEVEDLELVIIDRQLSPVQQRNLERTLDCKVIDRTQLILEIFGARARTREGRLQVELATLQYQKSRLVRSWSHLERQRGGGGFTGGPGERQVELDRRQLQERILKLQKELEQVRRTRELHRKTRRDAPYPVVALVGYTNAGKSSLFNAMTGADVMAKDMLFATLDPTLRALTLPDGTQVMLSDTVGFVSNLPTLLVAAFRSTLEEVLEADVIVHVRDSSHPDCELQKQDVLKVLKAIGVTETMRHAMIEVYNKVDLLDAEERDRIQQLAELDDHIFATSAKTGAGLDALSHCLFRYLRVDTVDFCVQLGHHEYDKRAWLHGKADILAEDANEDGLQLSLRMTSKTQGQFLSLFQGRHDGRKHA